MFWSRLNPPRETFEQMERRLRDEVRSQPPDKPPLPFVLAEERKGSDGGWWPDFWDSSSDGGSDGGDCGGGD